jgi:carboxymethylenebutenolidase
MGLTDYIKDVAKSIAVQRYISLAVDFFEGYTAKNSAEGRPLRARLSEDMIKAKLDAAIQYLRSETDCSARIGVMGFCMGGAFAVRAACFFPKEFKACSVFYGKLQNVELLKHIECPVVGTTRLISPPCCIGATMR